ncbi:MAG: RNA polymerase sigma factor [Burkholderiales bacterium]|nr:RNA polymerase sigma factor [Burkholderiales bacterium]
MSSPVEVGLQEARSEEAALLHGLRERNARAFEQLMRRYNRLLFRAARGIVGDDAEAQDVVQETWLKAFTSLESFRGDSSLATWLVRIAINQALGQQRKLGRLVAWQDEPGEGDDEMAGSNPIATNASDWPTPEEEAQRRQLRRLLEAAIDLLPPIYRSVFILRAVEGLAVEDTAAALRVSAEVVKTRFLRARAMLRTHLLDSAELEAQQLHDFLGQRCDDVVAGVLARLRAGGVIRDH